MKTNTFDQSSKMSRWLLWHVVNVNSVLQTESGIVVDGEAVPLKRDVKEQLEWILAKNEIMKKMTETTDQSSSFHGKHGEGNIQRTLMDIFGAGSETTSLWE